MKKTVGILFIIVSVLSLLCSCLSLGGTGSIFEEHHVYNSKVVSSKLTNTTITTNDSLFLVSDMGSFGENRLVEENLRERFSKEGIKCLLTTDYLTGDEEDFSSTLVNLTNSSSCKYVVFINFEKGTTYTTGGGIATRDSSVVFYNNRGTDKSLIMSISTSCRENKLLHYSDTVEDCLDSICKVIVSEYLKYCQ